MSDARPSKVIMSIARRGPPCGPLLNNFRASPSRTLGFFDSDVAGQIFAVCLKSSNMFNQTTSLYTLVLQLAHFD